jgi:hypothetical protein
MRRQHATAKLARELMIAEGVQPADNSASREIIAMREAEE